MNRLRTGARWVDDDGRALLGTDPAWRQLLTWQKGLVDFYGYGALQKFQSGFGDEGSADNAWEKGQVAMNIDGDWRIASIAADKPPGLDWGVAPMPVSDDKASLYGGGYVVGNVIGVSRNSRFRGAGLPHPPRPTRRLISPNVQTCTLCRIIVAKGTRRIRLRLIYCQQATLQ